MVKVGIIIISIIISSVVFCSCNFSQDIDIGTESELIDSLSTECYIKEDSFEKESLLSLTEKKEIWRSNAISIIECVTDELESKGWKDINVTEGWGNYEDWGAGVTLPNETEENMFMYTVWGKWEGLHENTITAGVRIVFDDETPNGKIYKVFYNSLSGRYIDPDLWEGDALETNEIWSIDNENLLKFMYSY